MTSFASPKFTPRNIVNHWGAMLPSYREPSAGIGTTRNPTVEWRVSIADALIRFAATESDEQLAAAMESAVHQKHLSRSVVMNLFQYLPRRQRRLAARLNFLGESGMETIARMQLESLGLRVTQQVQIGEDRVDLVIDGWLIVEWDGDEWHNPVEDRIRTNRLIRAGYRVLRFGYSEVFERWDETVTTILEMLGVATSA